MNEQIKQLAEQAGFTVEDGHIQSLAGKRAEKFAELIVRECMNICKKHPSRDLDNLWSADAVAPDLVHQFEEYFGVEE